jgi:hypothetical protein
VDFKGCQVRIRVGAAVHHHARLVDRCDCYSSGVIMLVM